MTIKEVAQLTGLSHQAIYKRLKSRGVAMNSIKDKATGQLTPEGEAILRDLFDIVGPSDEDKANTPPGAEKPVEPAENAKENELQAEVERLRNEVEKLQAEVEKLRNQLETAEHDRDFLRATLEREQQLNVLALTKIPTPPPALPAPDENKGRLRRWWDRVKGRA